MLNNKSFKWIVVFMLVLQGCQIRRVINNRSGNQQSQAANAQSMNEVVPGDGSPTKGGQVSGGPMEGRPAICSELDKPCSGDATATFCNLKGIPGVNFNEAARIHAHGISACEARKQVLAAACKRGIDIKSMEAITCEADKSDGKCPVDGGICITLYDPHKCVAAKYGDQALSGDSLIPGWGGNSCVARAELRKFACSRNLNPERLGDVSCERMTSFQGDCPPVQPGCDASDKVPTACEVTPAGGAKLDSDAEGACLARYKLEWKICLAGQSPSSLASQVRCAVK